MNAKGIELIAELLRQALAVSSLVATANEQGRELDQAELDAIIKRADDSAATRDAAIDRAVEEGR